MTARIVDRRGRPFDEFDAVRLQAKAAEIVGPGRSYSVASEDGYPLCGFVHAAPSEPARFTAIGWRCDE